MASAGLGRAGTIFGVWGGLKGAVPILLGIFLLEARLPDAGRLYGIIAVVVVFSVVVQGSLIPSAARLLRVQMRSVEPQPWALGIRLHDEPSGVHHLTVKAGAAADGRAVGEITGLPGDAWVSFVVRDGQLAPIAGNLRLRPGDEVLVLADPGMHEKLATAFEGRLPPRLQRAAREGAGFVDQLGPPGLVAVVDQDPFAEGPACRGERLARACLDELLDAVPGELDDKVAGAVVAGGEERAGDAQAGKAHHRPGRHVAAGQRGRAGLPEEIAGPLSHACLLP
jgi:hypothetical protein